MNINDLDTLDINGISDVGVLQSVPWLKRECGHVRRKCLDVAQVHVDPHKTWKYNSENIRHIQTDSSLHGVAAAL